MDEQNNIDLIKAEKRSILRDYRKHLIVFLAVVVVVGGGFWAWDNYLSPAARHERETDASYQKYLEWQAVFDKAMKEDVYGGKTPQETLNMFIDALKKGDVELASKYFVLNMAGKVDQKWVDGLLKAKNEGRLNEIIADAEKLMPSKRNIGSSNYAEYVVLGSNGMVDYAMEFTLNKYSNIWKIERF